MCAGMMTLSDRGIALIKDFEGYAKELTDGRCEAYREVLGHHIDGSPILDIPTIGWGCTEGVKMGAVWTREQAEEALRHELQKHERIVQRAVTVDLTQGQYDALVSFQYNCGQLPGSTLLKLVNAGDMDGAARQFEKWTRAKGIVLKGLVRRRAAEKALFLSPGEGERLQAAQTVDAPPQGPSVTGSRKWSLVNAWQRLQVTLGIGTGGVVAADKAGFLPDAVSIVKRFASDHSGLLVVGGIVAGVIVAETIKTLMRDDVASGRYVPSGEQ